LKLFGSWGATSKIAGSLRDLNVIFLKKKNYLEHVDEILNRVLTFIFQKYLIYLVMVCSEIDL
jgi:hypothetical protein